MGNPGIESCVGRIIIHIFKKMESSYSKPNLLGKHRQRLNVCAPVRHERPFVRAWSRHRRPLYLLSKFCMLDQEARASSNICTEPSVCLSSGVLYCMNCQLVYSITNLCLIFITNKRLGCKFYVKYTPIIKLLDFRSP